MAADADPLAYLFGLGQFGIKFGLDNIRTITDALGRPDRAFRSIHVAGTNGKGSTCAMIESGLRASGVRTGLFTSPHLMEPTERIQINAQPISSEAFTAAFDEVHRTAEDLIANGKLQYHPTYFETVTAMAFLVFQRERVETAVIEVGLGGRLDSTNVIHPQLCVITPVDFDHEAYLGSSIEQIAGEKAGILKPGVPAVFARQRAEVVRVLDEQELAGARRESEIERDADWRADDSRAGPAGIAVEGGIVQPVGGSRANRPA